MNADVYKWSIYFENERIAIQDQDKIDPQNPPAEYGRPARIALMPQKPGWPKIVVEIPAGTKPVFFRDVNGNILQGTTGVDFCVGWNLDGTRNFITVSVDSNEIKLSGDDKGIRENDHL